MRIGVVVHGPEIVDSGYAYKIINFLKRYGIVKARLGGTMGRTAVIDANLEKIIDISKKLLPSQSIDLFTKEKMDIIILINSGKSRITGHAFGYKVFKHSKNNPRLIQIERPGENDGTVIPWWNPGRAFAKELSVKLELNLEEPENIKRKLYNKTSYRVSGNREYRQIAGVSPEENIFVNGIVIGRSTSSKVTIIAENGIIIDIEGAELKPHGVEKLGKINLSQAILKTGLLRKSRVKPRIITSNSKNTSNKKIAYLNHAAEDIYSLKEADMVVTVGDDTTLVAADILYRFNIPIIGITDGDIDRVVTHGLKAMGSLIIEVEPGRDDIIGDKIFNELFKGKETIEIEDVESFKQDIIEIINGATNYYHLKYN